LTTRCSIAAFIVCVAVARPLHGQDARLSARFAAPFAQRLGLAIDSASRDGLPAEPLVLRALEGQAKGAGPDQILGAVTRLRDALRVSRQTLGRDASAAELTTAAAALQEGVPDSRLAELHKLRGRMTVTAPLTAYLDLTSRGAPADLAWNRISDLARQHASDADFGRLTPADIGTMKKAGRPAGAPSDEGSR
jgi:hypothetical protein